MSSFSTGRQFAQSAPMSPSIIDRLSGSDPTGRGELRGSFDAKSAIRRDLEKLLNTRRRCEGPPADLKELESSLVNYGLPDYCGLGIGVGIEREELRRTLERTIQKFEPRFRTVRVTLIPNTDRADRTLRFRIDASLHGSPELVVFDSALEMSTAMFQVKRPTR